METRRGGGIRAMECHRCMHREAVEAGKYRNVAFEQTPCGVCQLVENSMGTIAYDEERGAGERRAEAPSAEWMPVDVLGEAVATILMLPPTLRDIVCWRYSGVLYRDIAVLQGMTTAAVEQRHRRAMRRWPILQELFREKVAKQWRRRPHGGRRGRS